MPTFFASFSIASVARAKPMIFVTTQIAPYFMAFTHVLVDGLTSQPSVQPDSGFTIQRRSSSVLSLCFLGFFTLLETSLVRPFPQSDWNDCSKLLLTLRTT